MHLFHTYHHSHIHRLLSSEFWLFEISVWLHVLGRSVIAIFIPILLLELDYTVREVILYYFIYHIFDVPLNVVARWFVTKMGARKTIILGTIFSIIFFIILYNLQPNHWPLLILLSLAAALYDSMYWVAHIYFFMESSKKRHSAKKDTSILFVVRKFAGIFAPAFGAVLLLAVSERALIAVSGIILFLSIVPLFFMKSVHDRPKKKPLKMKAFFAKTKTLREYVTYGLYSLHADVENVIWPMFIYIVLQNIESVALVPIIVSLTAIIFAYLAGKMKQKYSLRLVGAGAALIGFIWLLRLVTMNPVFYYISVFLVGLSSIFVVLPLASKIYERGEEKDALSTSMYRNVFSMSSHLILYAVILLLLDVFQVSFLMATLSVFFIIPASYFMRWKLS